MPACIGVVQKCVRNLDGEFSTIPHRIPGVDGEIKDGAFDLSRINQRVPQSSADNAFNFDMFAQRPLQQVCHVLNDAAYIGRSRVEGLASCEGKQLSRQPGAISDRVKSILHARAILRLITYP